MQLYFQYSTKSCQHCYLNILWDRLKICSIANGVRVMKMGNIVPRAGIKPISLEVLASEISLHHIGSLMSPLYPRLPAYAAPFLRGQCILLY